MEKVDFNQINAAVREFLEYHDMKETLEALDADERIKQQTAGP
jgi:hypothetical protein